MGEILEFMKSGTPWQILCAAQMFAIVALWRRYSTTSDRLFTLAESQVRGSTQVHEAIERIERDLKEIRRV